MKNVIFMYMFSWFAKKGVSNDDRRDSKEGSSYFRRHGRELVSKQAFSFEEKLGGATVVRLKTSFGERQTS